MRTFAEQLGQDIRYGFRMLKANPLFAAMAALSLALGIGANTAIYSFMDAILMRSLPVHDPGSLVELRWHSKDWPKIVRSMSGSSFKDSTFGQNSGNFNFAAYDLFHDQNQLFSSFFNFNGGGRLNVQIHDQSDLADSEHVSGDFFSGLGVPPAAGRMIDSHDDVFGAPAVVVISDAFWQKRFARSADAVGQSILINNVPFSIIGVAPPQFFGVNPESTPELYLPTHTIPLVAAQQGRDPMSKFTAKTYYWVEMMGRLRPGVSIKQAESTLAPMFARLVESTTVKPEERVDMPVLMLQPGAAGLDFLRRQYSKPLYVMMTLVGMILAIACANIANLLLARAASRRREMAVRLGLGASRLRVVRQLLTESVILSAIGGVLGVLFAIWGIRFLTLLLANGKSNFTLRAELNWHVLGVTIGLSLLTGILFGLAPAIQSTRVDIAPALKATRAGSDPSVHRRFFKLSLNQALVITQIAISLLMLVAAGLFVRTLSNLQSIQLGFNRENILLFNVNARQTGYKDDALIRFYDNLRERLRTVPGVRDVTFSDTALVSNSSSSTTIRVPGYTGDHNNSDLLRVGPDFFTTMQIPVLRGRELDDRDRNSTSDLAIVNEVFAQTFFGNDNPVGRHFQLGGDPANATDLEIIGVSKSARYNSLKQDIRPTTYLLYSAALNNKGWSITGMTYEVRTAGDPLVQSNVVRQLVHQLDARVPVANIRTQAAQIDQTINQERVFAQLCTGFAMLALVIACVGLYGSMAYSVARRTNEIGIRMALGAERRRIIWMVLRQAFVLAVAGLVIGLGAAWASSHLVESFLFQMKSRDPLALSIAAGLLFAAAIIAAYMPAWRASRIDPMAALRQE